MFKWKGFNKKLSSYVIVLGGKSIDCVTKENLEYFTKLQHDHEKLVSKVLEMDAILKEIVNLRDGKY
jgi:hypothetical protein